MRIALLLSGGVDSSVALRLLKDEGHDVRAYYLKVWLEDELAHLGDCPWEEDLRFVRALCEQLGVPVEVVPLQSEYLESVVAYALDELKSGRTPSPDIFCNQRIKFGAFVDKIDEPFDKVASGHYARVEEADGRFLLKRSPDPVKDQTYFLSNLGQEQLARAVFPIGNLRKSQVRDLAEEFDLPAKNRKDSQGICFLGKISYHDFVRFHLGERSGRIVERKTGRTLGEHAGYWFYTIGQRFGLGLAGGPWYVVDKDTERNELFVSHRESEAGRRRSAFSVSDINWISSQPSPEGHRMQVKIRHSPDISQCRLAVTNGRADVELSEPDAGIASGQHAVFYDADICLGGGIIV